MSVRAIFAFPHPARILVGLVVGRVVLFGNARRHSLVMGPWKEVVGKGGATIDEADCESNMATPSAALLDRLEKQGIPKSKRKLQKHLRSAGLAYISRTGKLIPAKKVADELCQCPQKCDERVPIEARENLFTHFYGLGEADMQNQFLRQNMDLRARLNVPETTGSGRPPRRITCKYLVPLLPSHETVEVCQKAFVSAFVITTKRVRLQREKLISSLGLNSYSSHNRNTAPKASPASSSSSSTENNNHQRKLIHTSQNNGGGIAGAVAASPAKFQARDFIDRSSSSEPKTSAEMPQQYHQPHPVKATNNKSNGRQKVKRLVDNPLIPLGLLLPDGITIAPVTATPDHDRDIAIVNNFFSNQLWKPEYIGTYS